MNKINPVILNNLKSSLIGRLKLNLYKEITGYENLSPTSENIINYFKRYSKNNYLAFELGSYILTDARYQVVNYDELEIDIDIDALFKDLDVYPVMKPIFFEVNGFYETKPVGIWINSQELKGSIGYFYTIALLKDNEYPHRLLYFEIRTSQLEPEPAFSYVTFNGEWVTMPKNDVRIKDNPSLYLCIQALKYMSDYYLEHFVSMSRTLEENKKIKFDYRKSGPDDTEYMSLIQKLYRGEIQCHVAEVNIDKVIPFSFDACFMIPFYEIANHRNLVEDFKSQGVCLGLIDINTQLIRPLRTPPFSKGICGKTDLFFTMQIAYLMLNLHG